MRRKQSAQHFDQRLLLLLENAYYQVSPSRDSVSLYFIYLPLTINPNSSAIRRSVPPCSRRSARRWSNLSDTSSMTFSSRRPSTRYSNSSASYIGRTRTCVVSRTVDLLGLHIDEPSASSDSPPPAQDLYEGLENQVLQHRRACHPRLRGRSFPFGLCRRRCRPGHRGHSDGTRGSLAFFPSCKNIKLTLSPIDQHLQAQPASDRYHQVPWRAALVSADQFGRHL